MSALPSGTPGAGPSSAHNTLQAVHQGENVVLAVAEGLMDLGIPDEEEEEAPDYELSSVPDEARGVVDEATFAAARTDIFNSDDIPQQVIERSWLRYERQEHPSFVQGPRAMFAMDSEVALENARGTNWARGDRSQVWRPGAVDPRGGATLPPTLNMENLTEETINHYGAGVPAGGGFVIHNTFNSVHVGAPSAPAAPGFAYRAPMPPSQSAAVRNARNAAGGSTQARLVAGPSGVLRTTVPAAPPRACVPNPSTPKQLLEFWVRAHPGLGLTKPLVDFTAQDRIDADKKKYSARKMMAVSFFFFIFSCSDRRTAIKKFEEQFMCLDTKAKMKIFEKKMREYSSRNQLSEGYREDSQYQELTKLVLRTRDNGVAIFLGLR